MSSLTNILVFDSGVGGLSVTREIQRKLPYAQLTYASDNAFFPYGTKGEAELIARVDSVLHKLIAAYPVDIVVVACNTASTLTLPHIRSHFSQPIVGVVPAIKPAAARSVSRVIGLLATPATIARAYTHNLIREYASDAHIISVGSSDLVQLAECKLRGEQVDPQELQTILEPFFSHPMGRDMDTLVLACTHFPLLRDELTAQLPSRVHIIDSGEAIARRVLSLTGGQSLGISEQTVQQNPPQHRAVFTKASNTIDALRPQLSQFNIHRLDILDI